MPPATQGSWKPLDGNSVPCHQMICQPRGFRSSLTPSFPVTMEKASFLQYQVKPPLPCGAQLFYSFQEPSVIITLRPFSILVPAYKGSFASALKHTLFACLKTKNYPSLNPHRGISLFLSSSFYGPVYWGGGMSLHIGVHFLASYSHVSLLKTDLCPHSTSENTVTKAASE